MRVRFLGCRLISERIVTDLPEPDSPMMHRTSPGDTSNETPLTALTLASRLTKLTSRSLTSTRGRIAACGLIRLIAKRVSLLADLRGLREVRRRRQSGHAVAGAGNVHMAGGKMRGLAQRNAERRALGLAYRLGMRA